MVIGINLIALPHENGAGAFRYIQLLLKAMGEYKIIDCHFVVYHQKSVRPEYFGIPDNLSVEYIAVPALYSGMKRVLFEQTLFYFYLRPCDVLYSYCTSLPLLARAKKVFTLHDVYYLTMKGRYSWFHSKFLELMTNLYLKVCEKVLTVSEFSYKEILKYTCCKKENLRITYNFLLGEGSEIGCNCDIIAADGSSVDLNVPFFLYVGSLQPGKNVIGMVDGFEKYCATHEGYQMIVVGKPTYDGQKIIDKMHGLESVHYLGYQSREVVEYLFSKCMAVVLLSFCEGFGIPPLEGFGYGKPALVSDAMSLPEVVGNAGCKVNPHDIDAIASGFNSIVENYAEYCRHIPVQLKKFDYHASVETFMDALGIEYKR